MIKKVGAAVSAVALVASGIVVFGATTAGAKKVKPNATNIHCTSITGTATWSPPIPPVPGSVKKSVISFDTTATGCTATDGVGGIENLSSITLAGTAKSKNATLAGLAAPATPGGKPTVIKATLTFKNAGGSVLCSNKAKLGIGSADVGPPVSFPVSSANGGKGLGGKCMKGKSVTISAAIVETLAGILSNPNGLSILHITNPASLNIP